MNEVMEKEIEIKNLIYEIREKQVMLDSDLAILYKCTNGTKDINKAVKRNINRFPNDFYFELTEKEKDNLRFQTGTANKMSRVNPHVFTEQGVAMLSSVLHTKTAEEVSIKIMRAFVSMRHFINENKNIYQSLDNINNKLAEHDNKLNYLFSNFDKKEQLFLEGETFDAYLNVTELLNLAKSEIIIIDNYADIKLLSLIRNINVNIILITKNSTRLSTIEIEMYNNQYHNLKVIRNNSFHDRYIIIDNKDIYHLGTSINNLGDKTFMIIKLEDIFIKKILFDNISKILNTQMNII